MTQKALPVALRKTDSIVGITDEERLAIFDLTREGHLTDRGVTPEDLGRALAERRADFLANAGWITQKADDIYRGFTSEMRQAEPETIKMLRMAQEGLEGPRPNREKLPKMLDTCEKILRMYDATGVTMEPTVQSVRISGPCGACGTPVAGAIHAFVTIEAAGTPEWSLQAIKPACHECIADGRTPEHAILTPERPRGDDAQ